MKNSLWCVIGLAGLLALGSLAEAAEWVRYGTAEPQGCPFYYDAASVRHLSKDLVRVWNKREAINQECIDWEIGNRRRFDLPTAGYEQYSHTLTLLEVNCSTGQLRQVAMADHGTDGMLSYVGDGADLGGWITVPPESGLESLYRQVCKQKGKR
jgi:hypothetical protein